eukprot:TRINITY_DN8929_c0_g1_i1.p1 TRINITY_DN8929_c0_g1~~TRINITY_DN8929_c0_g1_i1.p1  ORF type:complete len:974 (-),score=197.06 TRINITY_DN8929_c0_g1_i1:99-3020(-)
MALNGERVRSHSDSASFTKGQLRPAMKGRVAELGSRQPLRRHTTVSWMDGKTGLALTYDRLDWEDACTKRGLEGVGMWNRPVSSDASQVREATEEVKANGDAPSTNADEITMLEQRVGELEKEMSLQENATDSVQSAEGKLHNLSKVATRQPSSNVSLEQCYDDFDWDNLDALAANGNGSGFEQIVPPGPEAARDERKQPARSPPELGRKRSPQPERSRDPEEDSYGKALPVGSKASRALHQPVVEPPAASAQEARHSVGSQVEHAPVAPTNQPGSPPELAPASAPAQWSERMLAQLLNQSSASTRGTVSRQRSAGALSPGMDSEDLAAASPSSPQDGRFPTPTSQSSYVLRPGTGTGICGGRLASPGISQVASQLPYRPPMQPAASMTNGTAAASLQSGKQDATTWPASSDAEEQVVQVDFSSPIAGESQMTQQQQQQQQPALQASTLQAEPSQIPQLQQPALQAQTLRAQSSQMPQMQQQPALQTQTLLAQPSRPFVRQETKDRLLPCDETEAQAGARQLIEPAVSARYIAEERHQSPLPQPPLAPRGHSPWMRGSNEPTITPLSPCIAPASMSATMPYWATHGETDPQIGSAAPSSRRVPDGSSALASARSVQLLHTPVSSTPMASCRLASPHGRSAPIIGVQAATNRYPAEPVTVLAGSDAIFNSPSTTWTTPGIPAVAASPPHGVGLGVGPAQDPSGVHNWDEDAVAQWLMRLSTVPSDIIDLVHAHAITGSVLLSLSDEDLEGLNIQKFGHRRLLLLAAQELRRMVELQREAAAAPCVRTQLLHNSSVQQFRPTSGSACLPMGDPSRRPLSPSTSSIGSSSRHVPPPAVVAGAAGTPSGLSLQVAPVEPTTVAHRAPAEPRTVITAAPSMAHQSPRTLAQPVVSVMRFASAPRTWSHVSGVPAAAVRVHSPGAQAQPGVSVRTSMPVRMQSAGVRGSTVQAPAFALQPKAPPASRRQQAMHNPQNAG